MGFVGSQPSETAFSLDAPTVLGSGAVMGAVVGADGAAGWRFWLSEGRVLL